jgi:hypothetical protein
LIKEGDEEKKKNDEAHRSNYSSLLPLLLILLIKIKLEQEVINLYGFMRVVCFGWGRRNLC